MAESLTGQIIEGLWRFEALLPDWTEPEGDEEGWEQSVAWWALSVAGGVVLIDPLVADWAAVDRFVVGEGGCVGVVRTCHWHRRSTVDVATRYDVDVWARPHPDSSVRYAVDRAVSDGDEIFDQLRVFDVERADEVALWLPQQQALIFGDAMIRTRAGELRVCPETWTQPEGGPARLRALLRALSSLPIEHVLVSHGPLVLRDGLAALRSATC
jgi:glyoxylase-like metal-dependent hydrolase (beta-lactamase superfamily II)